MKTHWIAQTLLCMLLGAVGSYCAADQSGAGISTDYDSRLWRIEGSDTNRDLPASWLFGTIHVENTEILQLFDPLVSLLDDSERLILEVDTAALTRSDYDRQMLLPADQSLETIIGTALFERTLDAVIKHGLTRSTLSRYRPFVPIHIVVSPVRKTGIFLDEKIRRLAVTRNKVVTGLETLEEQMSILGGMTLEDQQALLSYTLDTKDELQSDIDALIQSYLRGELGALLEQSRRQMTHPDRALAQRLEDRLLTERNVLMVERLVPMLSEKSNFIAIGAAHLPGPAGVIELLRRQGFDIIAKPDL